MISEISINLPPGLSNQHIRVVLKYFEKLEKLRPQEWKLALESFDILSKAIIFLGEKQMSFKEFYDYYIDLHYADKFISQLVHLEDLENTAETIQNETAFKILSMLQSNGFYCEKVVSSEYLAAYCLYWWTSFSRGYRFELIIYRDLQASEIAFIAHDLKNRIERRSPYDLIVLKKLGDIKSTTYFLQEELAISLRCDFYITRIYNTNRRQYLSIVLMKESVWQQLNGDVVIASLKTVTEYLPQPVKIVLQGQFFVAVTFDLWKEKIKQRQIEEN